MHVARAVGLTKKYADRVVVDDVSFDIQRGEIVVLVGPNGSGKTTAMEMLIGLRRPSAGRAEIEGIAVVPGGSHRTHVGVQLQQSGLPNRLRVNEALRSTAALYSKPADLHQLLDLVGLSGTWKKNVDRLSGGQQRRLDVALACVGRPPFLVLDEPTSGLDPQGRAELWEMLRSMAGASRAILTSTHDLGEAEAYADRVIMIRAGRIAFDGSVAEALLSVGGEWRLRIPSAPSKVDDFVDSAGLSHTRSGTTLVATGSRAAVEAVRANIANRPELANLDSVAGPIRLEDVFLFAGRKVPAQ